MAVLNLGTIEPGKTSLFNVSATSTETGVLFTYKYKQGRLPAGLTIQPDGEIEGIVGDRYYELDNGLTTFDTVDTVETTTVDHEYTFTVTATGSDFELTTSNQQFKIKISTPYSDSHTSVHAEAGLDIVQRTRFIQQYSNNNIFDNSNLYRPGDKNFGVAKRLRMLLMSGIKTTHIKEYVNEMLTNFSNKTVYLGDLSIAKAKNNSGITIYEVLYYPVVDSIDGISSSQYIGGDASIPFRVTDVVKTNNSLYTADLSHYQTVYPNSLKNMRGRLDDVGQVTGEFLPRWMRSTQDSGNALGWIPAIPIAYCKPGTSAQIKYNVETKGLKIKSMPFSFNDISIDNHLGTTLDQTIQTVTRTGDGTTRTFTITTYVGDDSTTKSHTISSAKSVRITVDTVFQSPHNNKQKNKKTDNTNILSDSNFGTTDGQFYDMIYHTGTEQTADSTNNTTDPITITANNSNLRSTTITFIEPPASGSSIIITRKHNVGFDTKNLATFDYTERSQTDTSNAGDDSTATFTIYFIPKATPTVKVGNATITAFTYTTNTITFTNIPKDYTCDSKPITTDGSESTNSETNILADMTGAEISVTGVPLETTFDNNGTTFGFGLISFDIGRNSTRTLPIPKQDLMHDQGFAIQRYEV